MNLRQRIGKRIQELRTERKLKQSELAEIIGIATKTQSCIETGRNLPSAELFEKYAKAFNVDESELFNIAHIKDSSMLLEEIHDILANIDEHKLKTIYKIIKDII